STSSDRTRPTGCLVIGPIGLPPANYLRRRQRARKVSNATSLLPCGTGAISKAYLHDEISTDKRNPTVNANGLIFGATELSTDLVPVLDPVRHRAWEIKHPVRDPNTPSARTDALSPSPYWGAEPIWDSQSNQHNPMYDEKSRVWFTARVRPPANPD